MSFDEQPDGDIHGECAAEINRLEQWQNEASAMLATFIGLSSRPDEFEWSKVAIKVPALLAEEGAYKTDSELQIDRAEAKDQLDACRPHLKEGETVADALIRLAHAESFYRRRCEALQAWQSSMRNPERVIVCDILANGFTLDQPLSGDRYAGLMPAAPTTTED